MNEDQKIIQLKNNIIEGLKSGKYIYNSNKEGYGEFCFRNGSFFYDWYECGASPPRSTKYETVDDALKYLFDHSSLKYDKECTDLKIYQTLNDFLIIRE